MEKRAGRSANEPSFASSSTLQSGSLPPPYSSSSSPLPLDHESDSGEADVVPGLPSLKFNAYRFHDSTVSEDRTTITTWSTPLNTSLGALLPFLQEQAFLPPKPEIHIVGHHKRSGVVEEDFNLRLDMMSYLIPQKSEYPSACLQGPDGEAVELSSLAASDILRKAAGDFWNVNQRAKCLKINRTIKNWDTEYIEGRIRSLLSELRYRGETTITFPIACSTVVVRPAKGIADIFSIFSTTLTINVDVVWPFASTARRQASSGVPRRCNVCDERVWWNTWRSTVREAIISKQKGWVGTDAWLEVSMGCKKQSRKPSPWGMDV